MAESCTAVRYTHLWNTAATFEHKHFTKCIAVLEAGLKVRGLGGLSPPAQGGGVVD